MEQKKQGQKPQRPVTVKIEDFKRDLQEAVMKSELPPFMLEMLLGEYLAGVSVVAKQEYTQSRAEWEAQKAGEKRG